MINKLRQRIQKELAGRYPPISESGVQSFEAMHDIKLPETYRKCLIEVSNGADNIFRLGEVDSGFDLATWSEEDGLIGRLSEPFPHTKEWNDLSGMPDHEYEDSNPVKYDQERELFEARYWGPINGAIPIAHLGCAIRHWIVVSGPERGSIWEDDRANLQGFYPLETDEGTRMDYIQWFDWQTSGT